MELGGRGELATLQTPLVSGAGAAEGDEVNRTSSAPSSPQAAPRLGPPQQVAFVPASSSQAFEGPASRKPAVSVDSYGRGSGASSSTARAILSDPFAVGADGSSGMGARRGQWQPARPANSRRMVTPSRVTADARNALQRSLRADSVVANCVAGRIHLERLAERLTPRVADDGTPVVLRSPERERGNLALSTPWSAATSTRAGNTASSTTASSSSTAEPARLQDAQMLQKYGTGENLVIQLRMYGEKDLFVFVFGCVVFWGFTPQQLQASKQVLRDFMERELTDQDLEEERMEFVNELHRNVDEETVDGQDNEESAGLSAIRQDQIILTTSSPLERLAHSYALAQSVRLAVFENAVDRSIANTRSIPETMADTGEVNLDSSDLARQMGGLLMLRCDVNLHTDILDTPEIFWDEERYEPHYIACRSYLDVDKRVDILNQRLGVLKDLYDLLQNGLNVKHGNKLEVIIIVLILLEVVLELLELLHDYWIQS